MSLYERLKQSPLYGLIVLTIAVASATYGLLNVVVIQPLRDDVARQDKRLGELKEELQSSRSGTGSDNETAGLRAEIEATKLALASKDQVIEQLNKRLNETSMKSSPRGRSDDIGGLQRESRSVSPPIASHTVPSSAAESPSVSDQAEELLFRVKRCVRLGEKATCTVSIENKGDRKRRFFVRTYASYIVDNLGNKYSTDDRNFTVLDLGGGKRLQPGLPTNISVSATNVSLDATTLSVVLDFGTNPEPLKRGEMTKYATVTLRDAPLGGN